LLAAVTTLVAAMVVIMRSRSMTAVWTLRLAPTTGELEAGVVVANLMVAAQGALLLGMAMTRPAEA
jgi:hypothetical protein